MSVFAFGESSHCGNCELSLSHMNTFWDKYYQKPLDEIPWQNTQADWFKELVDGGEISDNSALDLGCGTGKKSIYLAQKGGFKKVLELIYLSKRYDMPIKMGKIIM